jgi:hypothetical protein
MGQGPHVRRKSVLPGEACSVSVLFKMTHVCTQWTPPCYVIFRLTEVLTLILDLAQLQDQRKFSVSHLDMERGADVKFVV